MTQKKIILPVLLLLCQFIMAQNDTIAQLDEVIINDTQLRDFSGTQSVTRINDSVIKRNPTSLTSLLGYNTVIYFKENGPGMVSSPSFRGTTAQQTAVIWNGININSQLNGQTDFNTINAQDFSTISARAGGGSVIYGSSAIGGSIHLDNELTFGTGINNGISVRYGSFNTFGSNYRLMAGTERLSANLSVSRNSSDNDYEYPGYDMKNENGQYYNTSVNAALGYKINKNNVLRFYGYLFDGERHFSGTLVAPSRSKYDNTDTRSLLEWVGLYSSFTSKLKTAYLTENYNYYANHESGSYTYGEVKNWLARYDLSFNVTDAIRLNTLLDYTVNKGEGSDIVKQQREIASGSLLMKHTVTPYFRYEAGIRKEITNNYKSPLLFSVGAGYDVSDCYTIKINASRNFRIPTFNDLYWQGSGNPNLKPETSYQAEIGNELKFEAFTFTITGYYIKLRDMLRWVPRGSLWGPENTGRVNSYGIESILSWSKLVNENKFMVNATYAYTTSREEGKAEQLIYVPLHKATASLAWSYKNISAWYRHIFNGEVFYTSDNLYSIDPYNVSAIGAEYHFGLLGGLDMGLQAHNLWSEEYQNVAMRPMPGRNYTMYLNFKF